MILAILLFLNILIKVQSECCLQDRGEYAKFNSHDNPNFQCFNGMIFTDVIKFYCTFDNIPQIMIATLTYEYDKGVQFQFKILTTTTQEWSFSIQCFNPTAKLTKYVFTWIATADNRILVVNDYLDSTQLVTGYVSPYYKHPNSNGDLVAKTQIVSYFGGFVDTNVDYLTTDSAAFYIRKGESGLGIQMIIGWKDCFLALNQMWVSFTIPNLQVPVIPNPNYIPIIRNQAMYPILQLTEQESDQKQFNVIQTIQNDGTIKISIQFVGTGIAYFFYWSYFFEIGYQPLFYKKMRVSKKISLDPEEFGVIWNLTIIEGKKNYIDSQSVHFDETYTTLSLIYTYQCQPGIYIVGSILKCLDCKQNYYNFTQYCNKSFNQIRIFLKLFQIIEVPSKFYLQLNSQGISLEQTITKSSVCPEIDTFQLIKLQIFNR